MRFWTRERLCFETIGTDSGTTIMEDLKGTQVLLTWSNAFHRMTHQSPGHRCAAMQTRLTPILRCLILMKCPTQQVCLRVASTECSIDLSEMPFSGMVVCLVWRPDVFR